MSDDDAKRVSMALHEEEARMKELMQVAMGPDDNSIHMEDDDPSSKPSNIKRNELHNQLTESISSTRDTRISEADATMLLGTKRPSGGATSLSEMAAPRHSLGDELAEDFDKQTTRIARYDRTLGLFIGIFTVVLTLLFVIQPATPGQQMGLQIRPIVGGAGSALSSECGEIATILEETSFVNGDALDDPQSPQHQALVWICKEDPAKLDMKDSALLTRYALASFYFATEGREWTERSNWLTATGYCSWYGITCVDEEDNVQTDANGEIMVIELPQNFLRGKLPPELAALSDALGFHLDSNFLYGPIPTELGRLTKLEDLWLSDNQLSGTVPKELGNMVGLRELTLAANELTGELPKELSQATNLHYFAAEDNHLNGTIPGVWFQSLTGLKTFHASNNELTGSIPDEVYGMTSLTTLRLSENGLTGSLSTKVGQLVNLENLHLTDNHLTGELPDAFSTMDLLSECKLGENEFTGGVPASLGESLALTQLALEGNTLTGEVPRAICALTEGGSLVSLTADCRTETEAKGVVCDCCTGCF